MQPANSDSLGLTESSSSSGTSQISPRQISPNNAVVATATNYQNQSVSLYNYSNQVQYYNPYLTGLPIITAQGYVYYAQPTANTNSSNHNVKYVNFETTETTGNAVHRNTSRTVSSESYRSNSSRKRSYSEVLTFCEFSGFFSIIV